jgi:hypothetical protein
MILIVYQHEISNISHKSVFLFIQNANVFQIIFLIIILPDIQPNHQALYYHVLLTRSKNYTPVEYMFILCDCAYHPFHPIP